MKALRLPNQAAGAILAFPGPLRSQGTGAQGPPPAAFRKDAGLTAVADAEEVQLAMQTLVIVAGLSFLEARRMRWRR
jgi:hypothetical protein